MNKGDLSKEIEYDKIEVVNSWNVQVKCTTKIMEVQDVPDGKNDGKGGTVLGKVQISEAVHRHVLVPFSSSKDSDDKWTHTATDISSEDAKVQAIANASWDNDTKSAYKTWKESQL